MNPLSHRALSMQLSAIKAMERKARGRSDILSLAQGIPYFPTPSSITDQVVASLQNGQSSYYTIPEGLPSLRQKISEEVFQRTQASYHPQKEILVTAGAMAAIQATLLTIINPGDEVIVISPAYASYYGQIITAGGIPRTVGMDPGQNFRLVPSLLKQAITPRTKAILFANPSNPTGTNFTAGELESICEVACQHDLSIIADEVYKDFVWEGEHLSCASFPQVRDRLFLVFGFSKAYAMTGYRVGYLCGPARVIEHVLKIHDNLVTCAPHPAQVAAEAALQAPSHEMVERLGKVKKNRERILQLLKKLPFLSAHVPQGAYYIFARVLDGNIDSFAFCQYLLEEAKVATVPGIAFGPEGEGYVRMCYAVDGERIQQAFERMEKLFQKGIDFSPFEVAVSLKKSA